MTATLATRAGSHPAPLLYPPTVAPAERPLPLMSFLWRFLHNPIRTLPRQVYEEPLVFFQARRRGAASIVWVTAPDLVERILLRDAASFPKSPLERRVLGPALGDGILTAEGQSWRWQRGLVAPLFRHQDLLAHIPAMNAAADIQITRWRRLAPGSIAPVDRDMADLTYDVITRTILAGAGADEGHVIKTMSTRLLNVISWEIAAALLSVPERIWHPGKGRARRGADGLRTTVGAIVARARTAKGLVPGLLGRLISARHPETGAPMSDGMIVDTLLTFLLAGHETTAKAMTWTLYLLARAPDVQDAVRAEVARVVGAGAFEARHMGDLALTTRVLKESMRLYPPAPFMTRVAAADTEIAGKPIPAGTLVNMPIYAIHRHQRLWPDPDRFDPDRFLPEREATYPRTQFMPFGYGQRTCIGMAFAMIEATALLARLVATFRFDWDGRHAPEPVSRITLRPKGGMPLILTPVTA